MYRFYAERAHDALPGRARAGEFCRCRSHRATRGARRARAVAARGSGVGAVVHACAPSPCVSTAATAPVNVLQTVLNLELTYASRQTPHFERFRSTCNACLGDDSWGPTTRARPPGTTRACLPCGEFCAAQTLTWEEQRQRLRRAGGIARRRSSLHHVSAVCGAPTARSQRSRCPVRRAAMSWMMRGHDRGGLRLSRESYDPPAHATFSAQFVARRPTRFRCKCTRRSVRPATPRWSCYPMLGPGQTLLCPPVPAARSAKIGARRRLRRRLRCTVCVQREAPRPARARCASTPWTRPLAAAARLLDWTTRRRHSGAAERASFAVHVDTCGGGADGGGSAAAVSAPRMAAVLRVVRRNFFCPAVGLPVPPAGADDRG